MSISIVPLRDGRAPLTDIPGRLRVLADNIEAGVNGDIHSCIVLLTRPGDFPAALQYGEVDGPNDPIIQLQLALHWFVTKIVVRK
jgi:hypothetical protein